MSDVPDNTPVAVGVGIVQQRVEDPAQALEPLALMLRATRDAGRDAGSQDFLRHVDKISVPKGRWKYGDPGRAIARDIGADRAVTELGAVGVLQQTLIGDACRAVQEGEHRAVLVVGGEAGYRILRGKKAGVPLSETEAPGPPDRVLKPQAALRSAAELAAGFDMPVGLYAMLDCGLRHARGETAAQRLSRIGTVYQELSLIAADNPDAWPHSPLTADEINTPSAANRLQAYPYTKLHCSNWSVDQASALLIMSAGRALALGIPARNRVFAMGSAESNHMETVTSRRELHRSPGARLAGHTLLGTAGLSVDEIDLIELYSCFPVALDVVAEELGIARHRSLSITGGMAYAGGPYNNYVLHATAQMIRKLRKGEGQTGLVGCISGILTKQGFGLWSASPPKHPFAFRDVTSMVAAAAQPCDEAEEYEGPARIVAWTVLNSKGGQPRAIVIGDTENGRRCVASAVDNDLIASLAEADILGREIAIVDGTFSVL